MSPTFLTVESTIMDVLRELLHRFITPAVQPFGLQLDADMALRKWTVGHDLCCIVAVGRDKDRYSAQIGFFSTFLSRCFELPDKEFPSLAECNTCGIRFTIGDLLGMKLQMGWTITEEAQLKEVGPLFQTALTARFPHLFEKYMAMNGWINHFQDKLKTDTGGRGRSWTMLGYCLLGRTNTTFEEIQQVIEAHSHEQLKSVNRLDMHLERQRVMVYERFGRQP
jgi:hypothetical protein